MVSYSDEFKLSQNFLYLIFIELALLIFLIFGSVDNAAKLSLNITKVDIVVPVRRTNKTN